MPTPYLQKTFILRLWTSSESDQTLRGQIQVVGRSIMYPVQDLESIVSIIRHIALDEEGPGLLEIDIEGNQENLHFTEKPEQAGRKSVQGGLK